ncbi:MAG: hypothetical protein ACOX6O_01040 [Christensenellales bacterium]|jgi:hypothetical protein
MNAFFDNAWTIAIGSGIILLIIANIKIPKPIQEKIVVPIEKAFGLCVGQQTHDGCIVEYNEQDKTLISKINFNATEAKICSTIIRTGDRDMRRYVKKNKQLKFNIKASNAITKIVVEFMLKDRENFSKDVILSKDLEKLSDQEKKDGEKIILFLSDFQSIPRYWEQWKEIKFFLRRSDNNGQGGTLQIKNVVIE